MARTAPLGHQGYGRSGPGLGIALGERRLGRLRQSGFRRLLNPAVNSQNQVIAVPGPLPPNPAQVWPWSPPLPACRHPLRAKMIRKYTPDRFDRRVTEPVTLISVFLQLFLINFPHVTLTLASIIPLGYSRWDSISMSTPGSSIAALRAL